eukprot:Pgem_evm2s5161
MEIITSRIVPILPSIISPGQSCNVPGRSIEDNMKLTQTVLWKMNRKSDNYSYNHRQILNTEWEFLFHLFIGLN